MHLRFSYCRCTGCMFRMQRRCGCRVVLRCLDLCRLLQVSGRAPILLALMVLKFADSFLQLLDTVDQGLDRFLFCRQRCRLGKGGAAGQGKYEKQSRVHVELLTQGWLTLISYQAVNEAASLCFRMFL